MRKFLFWQSWRRSDADYVETIGCAQCQRCGTARSLCPAFLLQQGNSFLHEIGTCRCCDNAKATELPSVELSGLRCPCVKTDSFFLWKTLQSSVVSRWATVLDRFSPGGLLCGQESIQTGSLTGVLVAVTSVMPVLTPPLVW